MQIITYDLTKKKNSTKQPSNNMESKTIEVTLKDGTSILRPTFRLSKANAGFNYLYAANFGRYYFVNDITWINKDMAEVSCEVDPMATAKSAITRSTFYVERAAGSYNSDISDGVVIPTTEIVQSVATEGDVLSDLELSDDNLVVRVVGKNGLKNYKLNMATLQNAFNTFFDISQLSWQTIEEALNAIFISIAEPAAYIKSVKWYPFKITSDSSEICYFGFVPTSVAVPVANNVTDSTAVVSKPARYYNDWRDFDSRFTSASIFLPGLGSVDLDPKHLQGNLNVWYTTDIDTGSGNIILADDSDIISSFAYEVGCDIPVGGLTGSQVVSSIGSVASGAASLNVAETAKGVVNAIEAHLSPMEKTFAGSGNRRFWRSWPTVKVSVTRLGSSGMPGETKGRPRMQSMSLANLTGYVQCSDASIECGLTAAEKDMINGYLNSGFYIE